MTVFQRRMAVLAVLFSCGYFVMAGRLVQLQAYRADEYRQKRDDKRDRLVQVPPVRGRILDRAGRVLAEDRPAFEFWLVPARYDRVERRRELVSQLPPLTPVRIVQLAGSRGEQRELERRLAVLDLREACPLTKKLGELLGREPAELAEALVDAAIARHAGAEEALTIARPFLKDVGIKVYQAVMRERLAADGLGFFAALEPRVGTRRVYPAGADLAHVTGYVGKLTEEEYDQLRGHWSPEGPVPGHGDLGGFLRLDPEGVEESIIRLREIQVHGEPVRTSGYFRKEEVGRAGIEMYYNQRLRGYHTLRYLRLERPDKNGPRVLAKKGFVAPARHGQDVPLTIDLNVQHEVRRVVREELGKLEHEKGRPFQAAVVLLDPHNGRIYALVSEPGYDPNRFNEDFAELNEDPRHPLINHVIAGEYPPGSVFKPLVALGALQEGAITAQTTFCCEGVLALGRHEFPCMHKVHHGDITVEEALEKSCNIFMYHTGGVLGSRKIYEWAWRLGSGHRTGVDLAGEASGQLPMRASTGRYWAKGNTYHLAIGQGPLTVTPLQIAVAFAAIANGGAVVQPHLLLDDPTLDEPRGTIAVSDQALATVRRGMWRVVQGDHGTAKGARLPGMEVAGKTGTAQWRKSQPDHAWFGCYAPFDDPQVVCVVLVPQGTLGGGTCGPIARRVLMAFFGIPEESGDLG